jgi:prepilin-type N-terminal cleavage/methylation domain-containing protein
MKHRSQRGIRAVGFTLVELMVVIAIIAVLAGFVVYLLPGVKEKQVRGRVKTELAMLVMAIEGYKAKMGFYPPDSVGSGTNALFYELTGTARDIRLGDPVFIDKNNIRLATNTIGTYFGTSGFLNSYDFQNPDPEKRHNFLPNLKPGAYARIPNSSEDIRALVVPAKSPGGDFNPWHYNSSNPQHNPEGFDLWAEVAIGNKTIVIGNWKE